MCNNISSNNNQFFLTLPSNSSMDYFPNNTVSTYTTHLSKQVRLEGGGNEWEMSLVEAHYPCSFPSVINNSFISFTYESILARTALTDKEEIVIKVKPEYYRNINNLLNYINNYEDVYEHLEFKYDMDLDRVKIRLFNSNITEIKLSKTLSLQLGFDPLQENLLSKDNYVSEIHSLWAPNLNMGLPAHMYVYCDLVEPQMVGDTTAPLLKIVNIDRESYFHGAYNSVTYTTPHYVPCMKTTFETIEIDLRDHTGGKLPFMFGTSYVKLHLRRAQD